MSNFDRLILIWKSFAAGYLTRKNLVQWLWVLALAVVLGSMISGCSPLYVMQAAYEEGKILWRREPITEFIEKPDIDGHTKEKLALVLAVRRYAQDTLKMNVGGSYSSYSFINRPNLTYVLTAAPKTELKPYTWWFLIIGRVPYKGYFSKEDAEAAAAELRSDGYDTNIRTSAAFSTLGWFDDPLLTHLLRYDKVTLADVIFHELFHNTLYINGAGNFNESVANFVGGRAAIDFFGQQFGKGSEEYRRAVQAWQEELEFSEFIEGLANSLDELYAMDIPDEDKLRLREEIFTRGKRDWEERIANQPSNRFRGFSKQPLNNAILINYLLYMKNLKLFESLYQSEGANLVRTIAAIRNAVQEGGEPFEQVQALITRSKSTS